MYTNNQVTKCARMLTYTYIRIFDCFNVNMQMDT